MSGYKLECVCGKELISINYYAPNKKSWSFLGFIITKKNQSKGFDIQGECSIRCETCGRKYRLKDGNIKAVN